MLRVTVSVVVADEAWMIAESVPSDSTEVIGSGSSSMPPKPRASKTKSAVSGSSSSNSMTARVGSFRMEATRFSMMDASECSESHGSSRSVATC